ncbi:MAG TPA: lysine 2,3-aminomutase, partial [Ideonella sp.]|nr:lysine 2,3-aminomutase [Ideonella sp.]
LRNHPEVTDVLFTGGDPLVMRTSVLRRYVEPLLRADLPNLAHIRFGTKALAYWPARFLTDPDADDLLRLFGEIQAAGKHVAVMAHYSHPRELATPAAAAALQRVRDSGAVVRCQAPLVRRVNDDPAVWADLWRAQVRLGAVPYYMFIERDTGPKEYFKVPLGRALQIYQGAYRQLSGLCRSVRGPSMSATPGKILVDGGTEIAGKSYFVLRMLQGRNPEWVGQIFLAEYDPDAAWVSDLRPAFGAPDFFYADELAELSRRRARLRLNMLGETPPTAA